MTELVSRLTIALKFFRCNGLVIQIHCTYHSKGKYPMVSQFGYLSEFDLTANESLNVQN